MPLLTVIYPQLIRPIPSMSVVEFQLDPTKGKLSTGLRIERNSSLYSRPVGGVPCTFRTCYETMLWPLSVSAAEWKTPGRWQPAVRATDSSGAIRVELRCAPDVNLRELKLDQLRFYLDGDGGFINTLYELLFSRLNRIVVRDPTPGSKVPPVVLPASDLPLETKRYVYKIAVAKIILSDPGRYGYALEEKELYSPLQVERIQIELTQPLPIMEVARATGRFYKEIKEMNPHFFDEAIPPGIHVLNLPPGTSEKFWTFFSAWKKEKQNK